MTPQYVTSKGSKEEFFHWSRLFEKWMQDEGWTLESQLACGRFALRTIDELARLRKENKQKHPNPTPSPEVIEEPKKHYHTDDGEYNIDEVAEVVIKLVRAHNAGRGK